METNFTLVPVHYQVLGTSTGTGIRKSTRYGTVLKSRTKHDELE